MNNILVIRPGAIGDTLLTFPVLQALKAFYAGAHITLVSNVQVLPLALASEVADKVCDFQDVHWSELFSTTGLRTSCLRDLLEQTDLAICWLRDPDGIVERNLKAAGIKHCIIAPGRPSEGERIHIVDYLARTLELPGVEAQFIARNRPQPEKSPSTSVGARVDDVGLGGPLWSPVGGGYGQFIDELTSSGDLWRSTIKPREMATDRFFAIHPGSGSAQKCWLTSHFASVIKRLWQQNRPVLLLAGPADSERVDDLLQQLSSPPTPEMLRLLTNAPLLEVARQLRQCTRYLGNDSGITHLAAMLGIPTIAIFGPTDPAVWRPVGPSVKVLQGHILEDITVDIVMEAIA